VRRRPRRASVPGAGARPRHAFRWVRQGRRSGPVRRLLRPWS